MDDEAALRLEQVKLAFMTVERAIDLRARRHLAVLAVGLAAAVSALVAGLARQLSPELVGALALMLAVASAHQLLALERLDRELRSAGKEANDAIGSLMSQGGEPDGDGPEVHRR